MKVLMLRNPSSLLGCNLQEGETGEVDKSLGEMLIRSGIAQLVESQEPEKPKAKRKSSKTLKGVSETPKVANAVPASIAGDADKTPPTPSAD